VSEVEPVPTLRWAEDHLRLLDQRVLPDREEYLEIRDIDSLAEAIRTLAVRGAPAIGLAAAYGAVLAAMTTADGPDHRHQTGLLLDVLAGTRPTAVNLFYCIEIQRKVLDRAKDPQSAVAELLSTAHRLFKDDIDASRAMGRYGSELLEPGSIVLTHCNAGGLATSGLGTALAVIYDGWERGRVAGVFADETRPLLQGARLTSWELCRAGIPVKVLPDSAAASLLATGEVDAIVVGSDRIAANGDVANKIGTYPLALAANRHGVPFYVAAPLSTFDPDTASGMDIPIEQRGREELERYGERQLMHLDADFWNPAFDVTPAELVTAIICEKGVVKRPTESSISQLTGNG